MFSVPACVTAMTRPTSLNPLSLQPKLLRAICASLYHGISLALIDPACKVQLYTVSWGMSQRAAADLQALACGNC